jgi:hypothetical protein
MFDHVRWPLAKHAFDEAPVTPSSLAGQKLAPTRLAGVLAMPILTAGKPMRHRS